MKKGAIIIATLAVVGGVIAMGIWFMTPKPPSTTAPTDDQSLTSAVGQSTDQPASGEISVHMRDSSFVPADITVKKGTKVTWINDDTMQHNVVADDSANSGGLPTDNRLLSKGSSYSFTFDTVGTFGYHCTPHPFMTGTVVVVP